MKDWVDGIAVFFVATILASAVEPTPIKISVVASGGEVTIKNVDGQPVILDKNVVIPTGSTISTGADGWIDLAQGGLSTIRVLAKTKAFEIKESSLDETTRKSSSIFGLREGAVFVRKNKDAIVGDSRYEIEMDGLIATIVGSEGEMIAGKKGGIILNVKGKFFGALTRLANYLQPIEEGEMMVFMNKDQSPGIIQAPEDSLQRANITAFSLPNPIGTLFQGGAVGKTASGELPVREGILAAVDVDGASLFADADLLVVGNTPLLTMPEMASLFNNKVGIISTSPSSPPPPASPSSP